MASYTLLVKEQLSNIHVQFFLARLFHFSHLNQLDSNKKTPWNRDLWKKKLRSYLLKSYAGVQLIREKKNRLKPGDNEMRNLIKNRNIYFKLNVCSQNVVLLQTQ